MKINNKEVGFIYTTGVFCDYSDYIVSHPDVSTATARLYEAEIMSREYAKLHDDAEPITVEELRGLMVYEMQEVVEAVKQAESEGSARKVETEPGKKRKA